MTSQSKPSIFQVLSAINDRSALFDDMSDDDIKTIHPYVLTRWLAGSNNDNMVLFLNELQNVHNNGLYKHKRFLLRLLQTTGGSNVRAKWMAPPKKTKQSNAAVRVVQEALECSSREAAVYIESLTPDVILAQAEDLGWQKDELKKLKQELA